MKKEVKNIISKLSRGIELNDKEKMKIYSIGTRKISESPKERGFELEDVQKGKVYFYQWELLDEESLNLIISHFHKEDSRLNPFHDYFGKLVDKPKDFYKPKSDEIEELTKYCSTISQFLLNPIRRDDFIKRGTWDLPQMIRWNNWCYFRKMYQLWGLEIFKYYDFTINHWEELSELKEDYTYEHIQHWFFHDWKLKENHFGTPRVKSFMVGFYNRNELIDEGLIKSKKLDIPHPDKLFNNLPKMEDVII
jgi:hypothetical protein